MDIRRPGFKPSVKGSAEWFTGTVRVDAPFAGSGALSCATVTFEPGARTAWHAHPLGQTLLITEGFGWIQREGGPIEDVRPDVPPFLYPLKRRVPVFYGLGLME
ncbi:hypothetical protein [Novacetimonas sp. GS1]|uniref:hypothetical protein n=1 Tax=Novacetimonas sp. GS1 TaxID=3119990 RepID=UPI002FCCF302